MPSSFEFTHDNIRVLGYSGAGEETWFALPELNVGFDFGRTPRDLLPIDHVFLSHGHTDHVAGFAYYFSQRMFIDNAPGHAYAPGPLVAPLEELLRLWGDIDGHIPPGHIHALEAGVDVAVRRDLIVRPFEVCHACRSRGKRFQAFGFSVIEVRKKLKDEYHGLHGPQIVELKEKGVEITRRVEMPLVTYCGDTGVGDFLELDHVRQSKILLLECTFVAPDHRDRARAGNHIHIADLPRVYPKLENERIVLTHLTRRTSLREARAALVEHLGEDTLGRVSFLGEHRRPRRRRPAGNDGEKTA